MLTEVLLGSERHEAFWALRNIDLIVREGERVGIVGPNGAGKTTLLKIIAGNLPPTAGRVQVLGRVSSLLSMAPAWNESETGVENIRFNLAVLGVPTRQIESMVDDIVDFTELGAFIFHPVKTYSTGMSARLSFAIATATDPEILIIDEVLGAGDGYFAWKAYQRMKEFCARGRALLFVSHSLSAVQQMCDKVVWMQNGGVRLEGEATYVLRQYELDFRRVEDENLGRRQRRANGLTALPSELPQDSELRLRIVPTNGGHFFATHYVRSIWVEGVQPQVVQVPLELVGPETKGVGGYLDILSSEWGRFHERRGVACRSLAHTTGRNVGGQFAVEIAPPQLDPTIGFDVEVIAASTDSREGLAVQMLDEVNGTWKALALSEACSIDRDWNRLRFRGEYRAPNKIEAARVKAAVTAAAKPEAEIVSIVLICDGEKRFVVKEQQPFEIQVGVLFNSSPDIADVGIKLTRADGVYVFWQSSGMVAGNMVHPSGERTARFMFSENLIGAGEYLVTAVVSNGWSYPENYPYSQIFARVVNGLSFRVMRELSELDLGVLNQRVDVVVE